MRIFPFLFSFFCFSCFGQAWQDSVKSNFANVGEVTLHYKIFGNGNPLILLHGSSESWREWKAQISVLAKSFKVYAIDSRGHGQSSFVDGPMTYDLLAKDIVELTQQLNIDSAFFVGYGDGGIIAMKIAISHPTLVRKIVAIGSNSSPDTTAVYAEVLEKVQKWDINKTAAYLKEKFKGNPNPSLMPQFVMRMQKMLLTQPNFSESDFKEIKCPALFMAGDRDIIKLKHTAMMADAVKNGFLSIIPAGTHYAFKEHPSSVNPIILNFLKNISVQPKRF